MRDTVTGAAEIITTGARLAEVVNQASRHPRVAVDLESNGFFRYPERICLVQLATPDGVYLLDPLAIEEVGPLGELLTDVYVEKVFHSADYDLRSLDRDWGFHVRNLFDTSIASAFVGSARLGLGAVLQERLSIEVSKDKKLQRADWTRRPLTDELQRYAAEDVRHLDRLREWLYGHLADHGRLDWAAEEFQRRAVVRHSPPDDEWRFLSAKGSRILDGRGLAILRSLHRFREKEAMRQDRPPFKVFSDAVLLALSADPRSDLAHVKGIGRYRSGSASSEIRQAIREGLRARPVNRPRNRQAVGRRLSREEREKARERLRLLKGWRTGHASRLKLDPGLLWPAVSLERLSRRPDGIEDELVSEDVRRWQRGEFEASLRKFLERLH